MLDYKSKLALAPMVRVSELPLRKLSLKYGADLVWGPEIVDKRMIASHRVLNEKLGTVDFVNSKDPSKLTWRTLPKFEKEKLVFQLGSSDPKLAVEAATMVAQDVAAIDLNCGCPKHFSVHSGMGAQLLQTPDKLVSILKSLVSEVGKPFGISISAKIRILYSDESTFDLVKKIVTSGISCLTVHCRTPVMRPREPAQYTYLARIAQICHQSQVACYVNGDVESRSTLSQFIADHGVDGAMIARAAQNNPSCFGGNKVPILKICREFLDACFDYDFNLAHAKYNLTNFVGGKSPLYAKFAQSKSKEELDRHLNFAIQGDTKNSTQTTGENAHKSRQVETPSEEKLIRTEDPVPTDDLVSENTGNENLFTYKEIDSKIKEVQKMSTHESKKRRKDSLEDPHEVPRPKRAALST